MNKSILNSVLILSVCLILSACRYSNEFTGTFNQRPAKLTAFSKNTDKYCIALTLTADTETRNSFIRADSVYDASDFQRPKTFNTKSEPCSKGLAEYLVGTRTSKVVNTSLVGQNQTLYGNTCRTVYYTQYVYRDEIQFEFRDMASDGSTGSFTGTGETETFVDLSHPVNYGPFFPCQLNYPNPGQGYPYPYPYPYPHPHPHFGN